MLDLKSFTKSIFDHNDIGLSSQVDCFVYFLLKEQNKPGVRSSDVVACFDELNLPSYSNIPQYLKINAKRNVKKTARFFVKSGMYFLTPFGQKLIEEKYLKNPTTPEVSNNLLPISLFENTRGYIEKVAYQAIACFDNGLYDACNVMLRRLLETLIIETFEKNNLSTKIKNSQGDFYYLEDLIRLAVAEASFNLSRNCKSGLKEIKRFGDLSAHNRRFIAKRDDLINISKELRVVYQEFLQIIDYPNWK
ncbi:DUF4145 domain-containing protein [Candidatus Shapirobacteria bacterium]|nr:DUF4145 domain-containing protein [Candidatus Shapirobacteria bacterium]